MEVDKRIDILSLINLIPYFGLYLDFLVELLGVSLYNLYTVYRSAAIILVLLSTIYVLLGIFGG